MTYIPEELMRSNPRQVELSAAGKVVAALAVLLVAGAIVFGAFLYDKASRDEVRSRDLRLEGTTTLGEIQRVRGPAGKRKNVLVYYTYSVGAQTYEKRVTLSVRERDRFAPGDSVAVRYLPSDPGFSSVEEYGPGTTPLGAVIAVPLLFLVGPVIIFFVLRRQRRYLAEGRPAIAHVTRVEQRWNGQHRTNRVLYEYSDLGGAPHTGSYDKRSSPPQQGMEFVVLYNRESPHRSARYPLGLVRVSGA